MAGTLDTTARPLRVAARRAKRGPGDRLTLADRYGILELHRAHPDWSCRQLADAAGVSHETARLTVIAAGKDLREMMAAFAEPVIQEWRKIGIEAEHRPLETATWYADGRDQGNFELMVFPAGAFVDDPEQLLAPVVPGSPQNWSRFTNPGIDDLYARQARTLDPAELRKLVIELQ